MCFSLPSESNFSCHLKVTGIISKAVGQAYEGTHDDRLIYGLLWDRQVFPSDRGLRAAESHSLPCPQANSGRQGPAHPESSQSANGGPWGFEHSMGSARSPAAFSLLPMEPEEGSGSFMPTKPPPPVSIFAWASVLVSSPLTGSPARPLW